MNKNELDEFGRNLTEMIQLRSQKSTIGEQSRVVNPSFDLRIYDTEKVMESIENSIKEKTVQNIKRDKFTEYITQQQH